MILRGYNNWSHDASSEIDNRFCGWLTSAGFQMPDEALSQQKNFLNRKGGANEMENLAGSGERQICYSLFTITGKKRLDNFSKKKNYRDGAYY